MLVEQAIDALGGIDAEASVIFASRVRPLPHLQPNPRRASALDLVS
jgi:hypothetical protein